MASPQGEVNAYFESSAQYWKKVYEEARLLPTIYRDRQKVVLRWIAQLDLPAGSRLLEIGCGAGLTTVALASSGHIVDAVDPSPAMVELTSRAAREAGVAARVRVREGDAHALPYERGAFDLVVAVGVIPWLHAEWAALAEMRRVLKPGGRLIVTADNSARLNLILDPLYTPAFALFRFAAKRALLAAGLLSRGDGGFRPKRHSPGRFDRMLASCGLEKHRSMTLGFGPFTVCGRTLFSDASGIRVHRSAQRLADRAIPGFRGTGSHYIVLAAKPERAVPDNPLVDGYFASSAPEWERVYERKTVYAAIYQQRLLAALRMVDGLGLPAGAVALDVGCGPGVGTAALASRGYAVSAVDRLACMTDRARDRARQSGLGDRVRTSLGDIRALAFADGSFDLVLVLGVTEWLDSLDAAFLEVARVLKPGGHLIVSADNAWALHRVLDPVLNPLVVPVMRGVGRLLRRAGLRRAALRTRTYATREVDSALARAGMKKVGGASVGFGPFSFCTRRLLPERPGLRLHARLQAWADAQASLLHGAGLASLALARKPLTDGT